MNGWRERASSGFAWFRGPRGLWITVIVVVLLAGGSLMGTLGVLVAVPLALICKVLWRELGQRFYREWAAPEPPQQESELPA